MAQIIKHRRGSISQIAGVTANVGELVMATGSVGDLTAPVLFIGSSATAGGYNAVSKIYRGNTVPDVATGNPYGSTLNGTPFYGITNKTLYILDNTNNVAMNLTGNIEGNTISNVTITNLTGATLNVTGNTVNGVTLTVEGSTYINDNLYSTGNTIQTGSIDLTGNISLGGNITIGNQTTDLIVFEGEVSSSILPEINNAFDLGAPAQAWKDLYVGGTAYIENISLQGIQVNSISLPGDLTVSGTTVLSGSVLVEDLTNTRLVLAGVQGQLTDSANLTYNGTELNVGVGKLTVQSSSGNLLTQGTAAVESTLTVTGATNLKSTLVVSGATTIDDTLNVTGNSTLEGTLTVTGATQLKNTLTVTGTTTIHGDETVNGVLTVTGNTQLGGNLYVSGNLEILGTATNVNIQSNTVNIGDNIIRLNAYSPFDRYAGFEVYDSGSSAPETSASLQWDSVNDYWLFVSSSGQSSKLIGTTYGTFGSENSLTANAIPKATAANSLGNSLLTDNATTLAYNTNKFTVTASDGATLIAGNVTLSAAGGSDANSKTSAIVFRNSSNVLGYVSTTETTDVLDGILGYKNSNGGLVFSTVIDGGTY